MSPSRLTTYRHFEGAQSKDGIFENFKQGYFKWGCTISINLDFVLYVEPVNLKYQTYIDRGFDVVFSKDDIRQHIAVIDHVVESFKINMSDGRTFLSTHDPLGIPNPLDQ
jgi:hypothetical protein